MRAKYPKLKEVSIVPSTSTSTVATRGLSAEIEFVKGRLKNLTILTFVILRSHSILQSFTIHKG